MEKEENKSKSEELLDLMHKIDIEMKKSRDRQTRIDEMTSELYEETKPMMVEKRKEEREKAKEQKAEFDEMNKNALVNAKKLVLELRKEFEMEHQENLLENMRQKDGIKSRLAKLKSNNLPAEKLVRAEEMAKNAIEKNQEKLKEIQKDFETKLDILDKKEKEIWDYAVELGVENEIDNVRIDEPETEKTQTENTEPAKTEPAKTEPAKTEPVKTEPAKTEPAKTEPVETEPAKTEPVETEPTKTEPVKTEPTKTGTEKTNNNSNVANSKTDNNANIKFKKDNQNTTISKIKVDLSTGKLYIEGENIPEELLETNLDYSKKNNIKGNPEVANIISKFGFDEEELGRLCKKTDPNIINALDKLEDKTFLKKYIEAFYFTHPIDIEGFKCEYNLKGMGKNFKFTECMRARKIANSLEAIDENSITEKENVFKIIGDRIKTSISRSKQKRLEKGQEEKDSKKAEKKNKKKDKNNKRTISKVKDFGKNAIHFTSEKLKVVKTKATEKAKSARDFFVELLQDDVEVDEQKAIDKVNENSQDLENALNGEEKPIEEETK